MKKTSILLLLFFIFFHPHLSAQKYITAGFNIDFDFHCDEEVIDEIGVLIPKPSVYLGFNLFKENTKIGFHFDGKIIFSHTKEQLCLGFASLLAPSFLLLLGNEKGFIISPGISFGFLLGGTNEDTNKKSTIGQAYAGIGSNITYFFKSGFSIGLNLNYYPFMFVYQSVQENDMSKRFEKIENSFSIGISIGYTNWF
jgi:hypothetical protein